jgi:hypothetical protein
MKLDIDEAAKEKDEIQGLSCFKFLNSLKKLQKNKRTTTKRTTKKTTPKTTKKTTPKTTKKTTDKQISSQ